MKKKIREKLVTKVKFGQIDIVNHAVNSKMASIVAQDEYRLVILHLDIEELESLNESIKRAINKLR